MSAETKLLHRLRRIEGQVHGLQRMIVDQRNCDEVLTQIMAAKAALDRVIGDLVEAQMAACFRDLPPDEAHARMARTLHLLCKR